MSSKSPPSVKAGLPQVPTGRLPGSGGRKGLASRFSLLKAPGGLCLVHHFEGFSPQLPTSSPPFEESPGSC